MTAAVGDLCRAARARGFATRWDAAPDLGAVLATGADAPGFLQTQLTSDVLALASGGGQLSARLDRKGALVAWFSLHRLPERGQPFPTFLMVLPRAEIAGLLADLSAAVITEDVILEDATAEFTGWIVQGVAGDGKEHGVAATPWGWTITRSLTGDPGVILLAPREAADDVDRVADGFGIDIWPDDDTARTAWDWLRVEAGWPRLGIDLAPGRRTLPQTGLEQHAVSATKGCYLGQEVVARIRTYGTVPEALRGLAFPSGDAVTLADLPAPGTPLAAPDGSKLGTWASAAWSAVLERPVALAFLGREHRTPGHRLEVAAAGGTLVAEVTLLPFHRGADRAEQARDRYDRAIQAFGAGRDDEAIALLEETLRLDPGRAEAYEALGVILGRRERFHEAIDIFKQLEEIAPTEPMVHTNLSLFYMKLGDKEEAERQMAQATLKRFADTDDPDAARTAAAAEDRARREDAERKRLTFGEVLALDADDPLALFGLGNALVTLERMDEAEPHLARACAVQPDNSAAHAAHGKVLESLGRADEAAAAYRRGVEVASRKGDLMPLREMQHRLALLGAGSS